MIFQQTRGSQFQIHPDAREDMAVFLGVVKMDAMMAINALLLGQVPGSEEYVAATIAHYESVKVSCDWMLSRLDQRFDAYRLQFAREVVRPVLAGKRGRLASSALADAIGAIRVASIPHQPRGGRHDKGGARVLGPVGGLDQQLPDPGEGGGPGGEAPERKKPRRPGPRPKDR